MYCPKCGCLIEDDSHNFCPSCGANFSKDFDYPASATPEQPHPFVKTTPTWFYILMFITLSLMSWGFYALFNTGTPLESIVKSQLSEIQKHQMTKAYYEYSSSEFKKNSSFEEFRSMVTKFPALSNHQSIKIKNVKQENNYGVVFADILENNKPTLSVKYEFIKEDNEWRILKIEILKDTSISETTPIVKNQLEALSQSKIDEAYSTFGSSAFKKATTPEEFQHFVDAFPLLKKNDSISFPHEQVDGNKATVTALIHQNMQMLPIEYVLIKEGNQWKIWSMRIVTSPSEKDSNDKVDSSELLPPVEELLDSIKQGKLKEAYENTASSFKTVTPFETFKSFIDRFPIFSNNKYKFSKKYFDKKTGKLEVELTDATQTITVEYILSQENGSWKILGMQILKDSKYIPQPKSAPEDFDTSFLTDIIKEQLQKIKSKDYYNAYNDYTSEQFRESTSFDQFVKFLTQNSAFTENNSAKYGELTLNNNIAIITGVLTGPNNESITVEYNLIKENDEWKILGIKIITTESPSV